MKPPDPQDTDWCCVIGCPQPARWRLFFPQPTPYTESCPDHVEELGGKLPGARVVTIDSEEWHPKAGEHGPAP